MKMQNNSSLLDLFIPPEGYFGDFGMLCGFTATRAVLKQIKAKFSGETSRPVLAAFIHPTVNAISDVAGLAWIWMNPKKNERGYALLHAKVALLGFRQSDGDGYILRLVVSTGNWTEDPLTNSIDLYWSIDLDAQDLIGCEQECVDVYAAWTLFEWLRHPKRSDTRLLKLEYDGNLPDTRLKKKINVITKIAKQSSAKARFMDSRKEGLMDQVSERMMQIKPRTKADKLIVGSGFFESGDGLSADSCVPELLKNALRKKLNTSAGCEIVFNPAACQGIAKSDLFEKLKAKKWNFKAPVSQHHNPGAKLHAKFVLLASGVKAKDECKGLLYVGSGNMTRQGFVNAAGGNGNIEAGVVFEMPHSLIWGKSSKEKRSICELLPLSLSGEEVSDVSRLHAGQDFQRPIEPDESPVVTHVIWSDGQLKSPEDCASEICIYGQNNQPTQLPCSWTAPPPLTVRLVNGNWQIPVLANGVFVRPVTNDLTIEDILAGLVGFPVPAEQDGEKDDDTENGVDRHCNTQSQTLESQYAIRRLMQLLVALTQVQVKVAVNDWPRWCRELEENLSALAKYENSMIEFFRDAGVNPLHALLDGRMRQKGIEAEALQTVLERVSCIWGVSGLPSLWTSEGAMS
jgi:hypothetical protein